MATSAYKASLFSGKGSIPTNITIFLGGLVQDKPEARFHIFSSSYLEAIPLEEFTDINDDLLIDEKPLISLLLISC